MGLHRISVAVSVSLLVCTGGAACQQKAPDVSDGVSVHEAWFVAAEKAMARKDPLQRCLQHPDPPGYVWPKVLVRAVCGDYRTQIQRGPALRDLIEQSDWKGLHALFANHLKRHYTGADPEQVLFRVFGTGHWPSPKVVDEYSQRWLDAAPDDPFALTLRAGVRLDQAWNFRGFKVAREVPSERMQEVRRIAEDSRQLAERAIAREPRLLPAYSFMLRALALTGDRQRADEVLRQAIEVSPTTYYVRETAAYYLQPKWGGSWQQVDRLFAEAAPYEKQNPRFALHRASRASDEGDRFAEQRQFGPALDIYRVALAIGPEHSSIRAGAWIASSAGHDAEAAIYLSQLLRFMGNTAEVLAARGNAWERIDDWRRALRDYAAAEEREPGNAEHPYRMATIQHRRQNFDLAEQHYSRVLELDPDHVDALRGACRMWVHLKLQPRKAEPYAERLTQLLPEDPDAWLLLANVHHSLKRPGVYASARRFLELAPPDDPEFKDPISNIKRFLGEE